MIEILKTARAFFPGKFIFAQIWAEAAPNDLKIEFFRFCETFCLSFFLEIIQNKN